MKWFIELLGNETDLIGLEASLRSEATTIVREERKFFLTLSDVPVDADAHAAMNRAKGILELINGAAQLALDTQEPLRVGSAFRQCEDRRDYFVFPEPAEIRITGVAPTISVTRSDGTVEVFEPANPVRDWTRRGETDEAAAKVLRLFGTGRLDWVNLCRILEIVRDDIGGLKEIVERGWATKASLELMERTANSPGAVGLEARHGVERTEPPRRPMLLADARNMIRSISIAWLDRKR